MTTSTFTLLKQGTVNSACGERFLQRPEPHSHAQRRAPSLDANTSYTAKVTGGSSGAKDIAGNALAADVSWSFTTGSSATNTAPVPVVTAPASTLTWKVGDTINFSGTATDTQDGTLPASALSWTLFLQHCPSGGCHTHNVQTWSGVSSGSFTAPDHEYPSYLTLRLTATDSGGVSATTSIDLQPQTTVLNFASSPSGLQIAVNSSSSTTPFSRTLIVGSSNSFSATTPQNLSGTTYEFSTWSDGGAQTHNVIAPATGATYTATYVVAPPRNTTLPAISGQARVARTLTVSNGTWTGSQPMTFKYQWLRCSGTTIGSCVALSGATAQTYVAASADLGFRLRATVTATNPGGSASATSAATGKINK